VGIFASTIFERTEDSLDCNINTDIMDGKASNVAFMAFESQHMLIWDIGAWAYFVKGGLISFGPRVRLERDELCRIEARAKVAIRGMLNIMIVPSSWRIEAFCHYLYFSQCFS